MVFRVVYRLLISFFFHFRVRRILQGHAEQGQDWIPRHVQKDVRHDVRAKLVPVPGPVPRPGKVLRRG